MMTISISKREPNRNGLAAPAGNHSAQHGMIEASPGPAAGEQGRAGGKHDAIDP
jgi:hypothetical protein